MVVNRVSHVVQTAVPLGLVVAWGVLSNCTQPNPSFVRAEDGAIAADFAPVAPDTGLVPYQASGDGAPASGDAMSDAPAGACYRTQGACDLPHATGGSCVAGACQGYLCEPGWGDCNNLWSDG